MPISATLSSVTVHIWTAPKTDCYLHRKTNQVRRLKLTPKWLQMTGKKELKQAGSLAARIIPEGGILLKQGSCKQGVTQEEALDVGHLTAGSWTGSELVLSLPPSRLPSYVTEPWSPGTASKGIPWIETDTSNRTKNRRARTETFVVFS